MAARLALVLLLALAASCVRLSEQYAPHSAAHPCSRVPAALGLRRARSSPGVAPRRAISSSPVPLRCGAAGEDGGVGYTEYIGPLGKRDAMEAGCTVGNLGLEITIGPSQVCAGRGLYVAVAADDGVGRVEGVLAIPRARRRLVALPCLRRPGGLLR